LRSTEAGERNETSVAPEYRVNSRTASSDWLERVKLQDEQFICLCALQFMPLSDYKWES
jgi:hypothetical protein